MEITAIAPESDSGLSGLGSRSGAAAVDVVGRYEIGTANSGIGAGCLPLSS
jgi:hypothetical protein